MSASPKFDSYRSNYPLREADLTRKGKDDELYDLSGNSDFFTLPIAPLSGVEAGSPPVEPRSSGEKMYLWLIKQGCISVVLEEGVSGKSTARKRLAHTNISGGKPAHAGGEIWFKDGGVVWLTGGSSRYPPSSCSELDAVVSAFADSGYRVNSCGWDEDNDMPARFFRGL